VERILPPLKFLSASASSLKREMFKSSLNAMPSNATLVGNWHVHGAASSFGNNVVDFGVLRTSGTLVPTNCAFPLGMNDEAFSSFWYFVDGRIRSPPVTITASEGNSFTMSVDPANLGGSFAWLPSMCSCTLSGSGNTFSWNCPTDCTCCGCTADGRYQYEGYWLPATSCLCGCHYDATGPTWEPSPGPLVASVSASFSKSAVIFENAYENMPGQWVGKNSTRTRLNIVASGGPNGVTLSVVEINIPDGSSFAWANR